MKRIFSRLLCFFLAAVMLTGTLCMGASAREKLDDERLCNLNMVLKRTASDGSGNKVLLKGAVVTLYIIGRIRYDEKDPASQRLVVHQPFASHPKLLPYQWWTEVKDGDDYARKLPPKILLEIIEEKRLAKTYVSEPSGDDGSISIEGINSGLYLVVLENGNEIGVTMEPFLATIPLVVDDEYDYDGTKEVFEPKMEITTSLVDIVVKKVWKGDDKDGKDRPRSITVELLNGSQRADEAKLNKGNNWTHIFKNKPKDIAWKVQEQKIKGYKGEVGKMTWVNDHYEVTIINTRDASLVQTGELKWPVPVLLIGGVLLMLGGYSLTREKKYPRN